MSNYRIRIAQEDYDQLRRLSMANHPDEGAAFALAGLSVRGDDITILVRRAIAIPRELYVQRDQYHLVISSAAINGLAALCTSNELGAILCHSHPSDSPYSPSDDFGERRVFGILRSLIPKSAPTASLLFYPSGLAARAWVPGEEHPHPVSEVVIVGRSIRRLTLDHHGPGEPQEAEQRYDRQVRAFGIAGQRLIGATKVAIVGLGGTGSVTAEQIARLGVTDLVLIDHDVFHVSNVTRVSGTYAPRPLDSILNYLRRSPRKVRLIQSHLTRINPHLRINAIPKSVVVADAAESLLDRDVIFLCTDDHWGRAVVNRIAYQYLIPTVNLGVRIGVAGESITAAVGVVDVLRPNMPCLWCTGFLRGDRIAAESMPRADRKKRVAEGYVENLELPTPSVVSLNTTISGLAVSQFLQIVTDFMGSSGDVARLNYDAISGTVRRGRSPILDGCTCQKVRGFGDLRDLPTQPDLNSLSE